MLHFIELAIVFRTSWFFHALVAGSVYLCPWPCRLYLHTCQCFRLLVEIQRRRCFEILTSLPLLHCETVHVRKLTSRDKEMNFQEKVPNYLWKFDPHKIKMAFSDQQSMNPEFWLERKYFKSRWYNLIIREDFWIFKIIVISSEFWLKLVKNRLTFNICPFLS